MATTLNLGIPAVAALIALAGCAHTADSSPRLVALKTQDAAYRTYSGGGRIVSVTLDNPRPGQPTTHFPEPPLRVLHRAGRTCDITGGNWSIDSLFLYNAERNLAAVEYSGSNQWISFYRTADCVKLGELDITDRSWKFSGDAVISCDRGTDKARSCGNPSRFTLPGGT